MSGKETHSFGALETLADQNTRSSPTGDAVSKARCTEEVFPGRTYGINQYSSGGPAAAWQAKLLWATSSQSPSLISSASSSDKHCDFKR
jgi:hypothetical protein